MSEIDPKVAEKITEILGKLQDNLQFQTLTAIHTLAEMGGFEVNSRSTDPRIKLISDELSNMRQLGFIRPTPPAHDMADYDEIIRLQTDVETVAKTAIKVDSERPYMTTVESAQAQRAQTMAAKYAPTLKTGGGERGAP